MACWTLLSYTAMVERIPRADTARQALAAALKVWPAVDYHGRCVSQVKLPLTAHTTQGCASGGSSGIGRLSTKARRLRSASSNGINALRVVCRSAT